MGEPLESQTIDLKPTSSSRTTDNNGNSRKPNAKKPKDIEQSINNPNIALDSTLT